MNFEHNKVVIKVIGIGDIGGSAISYLHNSRLSGIEFHSFIETLTYDLLTGADLIFLIADVSRKEDSKNLFNIAKFTKELDILTISIATKLVDFDIRAALIKVTDALFIIPNIPAGTVNSFLLDTVGGVTDAVTQQGLIGFDFADLKALTQNVGCCVIATGIVEGENRASEATKKVISSPLLTSINIHRSYGMIINISAKEMTISELDIVFNEVNNLDLKDVQVKVVMTHNQSLGGYVKVTIIAAGVKVLN